MPRNEEAGAVIVTKKRGGMPNDKRGPSGSSGGCSARPPPLPTLQMPPSLRMPPPPLDQCPPPPSHLYPWMFPSWVRWLLSRALTSGLAAEGGGMAGGATPAGGGGVATPTYV